MATPHPEPPAKQALLRAYNREFAALNSAPPIELRIGRVELICLISAVQLACRHPSYNGPSRKIVEEIMRGLTERAFADFPAAKAVVRRGWDPRFDDILPEGRSGAGSEPSTETKVR